MLQHLITVLLSILLCSSLASIRLASATSHVLTIVGDYFLWSEVRKIRYSDRGKDNSEKRGQGKQEKGKKKNKTYDDGGGCGYHDYDGEEKNVSTLFHMLTVLSSDC